MLARKPFTRIGRSSPTSPTYDLRVGGERISLKTETGVGTSRRTIQITKLCTTEREPWGPAELIGRAMSHLSKYDHILMLRAIWEDPVIDYQLVDVPVSLLRRLASASLEPVGRRRGRKSLGADVTSGGKIVFHIHFDASDGKCQIRNLRLSSCNLLHDWQLHIPP
ncbi:MAG: hypothetical protein ACE5JJ_05490 [Nitrospinota bacterium]